VLAGYSILGVSLETLAQESNPPVKNEAPAESVVKRRIPPTLESIAEYEKGLKEPDEVFYKTLNGIDYRKLIEQAKKGNYDFAYSIKEAACILKSYAVSQLSEELSLKLGVIFNEAGLGIKEKKDTALYELALDFFDASIRAKFDIPSPWLNSGGLLKRLGRIPEAKEYVKGFLDRGDKESADYRKLKNWFDSNTK